jgi:hypothetical protein
MTDEDARYLVGELLSAIMATISSPAETFGHECRRLAMFSFIPFGLAGDDQYKLLVAARAGDTPDHNEGLLRNADPAVAEHIYRVRDAQAVEGGCADERMDRPGHLGTRGPGGLAFPIEAKSGPAWLEGLRNRTPVQHNPSGKNDQADVGRPPPISY